MSSASSSFHSASSSSSSIAFPAPTSPSHLHKHAAFSPPPPISIPSGSFSSGQFTPSSARSFTSPRTPGRQRTAQVSGTSQPPPLEPPPSLPPTPITIDTLLSDCVGRYVEWSRVAGQSSSQSDSSSSAISAHVPAIIERATYEMIFHSFVTLVEREVTQQRSVLVDPIGVVYITEQPPVSHKSTAGEHRSQQSTLSTSQSAGVLPGTAGGPPMYFPPPLLSFAFFKSYLTQHGLRTRPGVQVVEKADASVTKITVRQIAKLCPKEVREERVRVALGHIFRRLGEVSVLRSHMLLFLFNYMLLLSERGEGVRSIDEREARKRAIGGG